MRKRYQTTPKEKREEILVAYLTGENSVEELANYYKVNANTLRGWIKRYRHSQIVVSLHPESKPAEDMARKQKESEKSAEVLALEARIRELELQNLALNTLIDVAERNGIEIRKNLGPSSRGTQRAAWPDHHCCL